MDGCYIVNRPVFILHKHLFNYHYMATKDIPLAKFHFQVEWGGAIIGFSEVSGLSFETGVIEYRDGSSPEYQVRKLPGLTKYSNITLKRGVFEGDFTLYNFWKDTALFGNPAGYRRDLIIKLLDDEHKPVLVWRVKSAWPCKMAFTDLNSTANEVLIESVELVHEGLSIVS
jgi:phage tail-like protein